MLLCTGRLLFDSHEELTKWKMVFEEAIAHSLGDDTVRTVTASIMYCKSVLDQAWLQLTCRLFYK